MKEKRIIGLAGDRGAGKDSVAAIIQALDCNRHPDDRAVLFDKLLAYRRIEHGDLTTYLALDKCMSDIGVLRFAGPLKEAVAGLAGCTMDDIEDRAFKDWQLAYSPLTPRDLLIMIGETVRARDIEFFVKRCMYAVDEYRGSVVITDLRYPNELHAIQQRGGQVFRVVNPHVEADRSAESDTALDDVVMPVIENSGSALALALEVQKKMPWLK